MSKSECILCVHKAVCRFREDYSKAFTGAACKHFIPLTGQTGRLSSIKECYYDVVKSHSHLLAELTDGNPGRIPDYELGKLEGIKLAVDRFTDCIFNEGH